MSDILEQIDSVLRARKDADASTSYVASLYTEGLDLMLRKVAEEATETLLAARDLAAQRENTVRRNHLVAEVADLWFHSMVMLAHLDLDSAAVTTELARRFGTTGLRDKPVASE